MMQLCAHLSDTQGGFFSRELRGKKMGFPISLVWCFVSFGAGYVHAVFMQQKDGLAHFTSKCFAILLALRPISKNGGSHFTPLVFCIFCAGSVHAVLTRKRNGLSHFTSVVFCRTVSLFKSRSELFPATISSCNAELSVIYGGSSPDGSDSLIFAILGVFDGCSALNPFVHNE